MLSNLTLMFLSFRAGSFNQYTRSIAMNVFQVTQVPKRDYTVPNSQNPKNIFEEMES
jgi:hypothetical protein